MKANVLKHCLISIALFGICINCFAQPIILKVDVVDSVKLEKIISLKKEFKNKTDCNKYINEIPTQLIAKGFIAASIDSIIEKENQFLLTLFVGKQYTWKTLKIPTELNNKIFNTPKNISTVVEDAFKYYENNGFPFAKISFDSVVINEKNEVSAVLFVDKGFEYRMDSLRNFGTAKINNNFLQHFLDIRNNSLYQAEKLHQISDRLNQLSYLRNAKNWDLLMLKSSYLLNLYLEPVNKNKFDAIIGFLPNNNQTDGKLLFTVDAKLNLLNAFAGGEQITLNWQQIQPQSPRIDIGFIKPYIFNTNTGLEFNFNLYKRDSAYLNVSADLGLKYELSEHSKFKVFISNFSTRIIDADTTFIVTQKKLPAILDMNITNLGVEYSYSNASGTNVSKRKGFEIKLMGSFGQKTINQNASITSLKTDGFNYKSLYDSINTNSYQIRTKLSANHYTSIGNQSVLKLSLNYALLNSVNYLQNELFQIGGFKLLRGFDEENIFTNQYLVNSVEYRYLFGLNSYFFGFTDIGFTQNKIIDKNYSYIGTGIGMALDTKQGILNISFALGKRNDLPFNFRESKIHVGIINNF